MTNVPHYTLIFSARKTISLIIQKDATLLVRAPKRASRVYIENLIVQRAPWIQKNQEKLRAQAILNKNKEWVNGETFLFLGELYSLRIGEYFDISINLQSKELLFPKKFLIKKKEHTISWYKKQAKLVLESRVKVFNLPMDTHHASIKITSAKTRWGSCRGNNINFTWRIIMAPIDVVDCVIVHELAHIREKNHSKRFWKIVEQFIPDYKEKRTWLSANQHLLEV